MASAQVNPQLQLTDLNPVQPTEQWTTSRAASIALGDFNYAMRYREQNLDRRLKISDELYLGWTQRKTWEGTRIPRAAMAVYLCLEQIEALIPAWLEALLGDPQFFAAWPQGNTTQAQAWAVMRLLRMQLRDLSDDNAYLSIRELCRQMYKSTLIYGNGICEWGWTIKQKQEMCWYRTPVMQRAMINHPQFGPMMVPTGQIEYHVKRQPMNRTISKPKVQMWDLKDFYIDPNTPSPNVQTARYCGTRHFPTVAELMSWRDDPLFKEAGFTIPSDKRLMELAKQKSFTMGDSDKTVQESYRGNTYQPNLDQTSDPNLLRIELIRYFQHSRTVFTIGRAVASSEVIYNAPNEYGMLPFLGTCYTDVPGRFYGMSICDLVEGDQRLAQTILNARIDELNLMIHPPIVRKRGMQIPSSMRRLRPGVEWEADNPKDDVVKLDMGNVTQQAFIETEALERRVQRVTGVTDLVALGAPSSGGNSANRTATGINTQSAATSRRVNYQVGNFEDQVLVPLLNIMLGLNKRYMDPNTLVQVLGDDGQLIQLDPLDVLNADVQFEMLGSTKNKTRQALQSGGLQILLETYMNPALIQLMTQQGMVPDFEALDAVVMDTMNLPHRTLWRKMTQQEQQAANQPSADQMLRKQMQDDRLQSQSQNEDSRDDTKLLQALISRVTPDMMHEFVGLPAPAEIEAEHAPKPAPAAKK